jgi:hypothetical protein
VLVLVEVLEVMDAETMRDYVAAIAPQLAGFGANGRIITVLQVKAVGIDEAALVMAESW